MSEDEKFDIIVNKLDKLSEEVSGLKEDVNIIKDKIVEMEKMDILILDEVERVHDIMIKKTDDLYVKISYSKAVSN